MLNDSDLQLEVDNARSMAILFRFLRQFNTDDLMMVRLPVCYSFELTRFWFLL